MTMVEYVGEADYRHDSTPRTGVLLANLGTPDAPTWWGVWRYLREFLSDPRVVEVPRVLWWPILYGVILNLRSGRSAHAYRQIWTGRGSPLLDISLRQSRALAQVLKERFGDPVSVELGMRYGNPSIGAALEVVRQAHVRRLVVLPLYPQYSGSTTGSTFDAVAATLRRWRWVPEVRFVNAYHDHPSYIDALAAKLRAHWSEHERGQRLLFSFHGVPKRYLLAGDPYHCQCQKTARLVAELLDLKPNTWQVVFQSRFGREEWLTPYCDATLQALPQQGVTDVDILCPGFAADCLETLGEVDKQNRAVFKDAGGRTMNYIPCLNDDPRHIALFAELTTDAACGWLKQDSVYVPQVHDQQARETQERAVRMGAAQ